MWKFVSSYLNGKKVIGTFYENKMQNLKQTEFGQQTLWQVERLQKIIQ